MNDVNNWEWNISLQHRYPLWNAEDYNVWITSFQDKIPYIIDFYNKMENQSGRFSNLRQEDLDPVHGIWAQELCGIEIGQVVTWVIFFNTNILLNKSDYSCRVVDFLWFGNLGY